MQPSTACSSSLLLAPQYATLHRAVAQHECDSCFYPATAGTRVSGFRTAPTASLRWRRKWLISAALAAPPGRGSSSCPRTPTVQHVWICKDRRLEQARTARHCVGRYRYYVREVASSTEAMGEQTKHRAARRETARQSRPRVGLVRIVALSTVNTGKQRTPRVKVL